MSSARMGPAVAAGAWPEGFWLFSGAVSAADAIPTNTSDKTTLVIPILMS
jgi:hypothetical protein